jgi:hypothetical protein
VGWRAVLVGGLVATVESQLYDALYTNIQEFELLSDDALRHIPTQVLRQKPHTVVLREREGVKLTPSFPSRDCSALTAALKPSAVDGMTINFSSFSSAVRNQPRKARASLTPVIKMSVLLVRSPAGMQVLVT